MNPFAQCHYLDDDAKTEERQSVILWSFNQSLQFWPNIAGILDGFKILGFGESIFQWSAGVSCQLRVSWCDKIQNHHLLLPSLPSSRIKLALHCLLLLLLLYAKPLQSINLITRTDKTDLDTEGKALEVWLCLLVTLALTGNCVSID